MSETTDTTARPAVGTIRTADEHADLLAYHKRRIEEGEALVEEAKGPVKVAKERLAGANEELTKRYNAAKADLGRGYTREYLGGLIGDGRKRITELVSHEQQRARDKVALGQPVYGVQAEFFPGEETPTAARDEMAWEAEGYLRGLRGDLEEVKDGDPPAFLQAIQRGYAKGQEETQARYLRAQEALKARETPKADEKAKDLNGAGEPEPGTPAARAKEREAVKKAKKSLDAMGSTPANKVPV